MDAPAWPAGVCRRQGGHRQQRVPSLVGDDETFEWIRTFVSALFSTRTVEGVLDVLRHETTIEERDAILAIEALRRAALLVLI